MSPSASAPHPFVCVTCDLLIAGQPTFHVGLPFCCAGCVANGPCTCSYDLVVLEGASVESDAGADGILRPFMLAEESADEAELVAVG